MLSFDLDCDSASSSYSTCHSFINNGRYLNLEPAYSTQLRKQFNFGSAAGYLPPGPRATAFVASNQGFFLGLIDNSYNFRMLDVTTYIENKIYENSFGQLPKIDQIQTCSDLIPIFTEEQPFEFLLFCNLVENAGDETSPLVSEHIMLVLINASGQQAQFQYSIITELSFPFNQYIGLRQYWIDGQEQIISVLGVMNVPTQDFEKEYFQQPFIMNISYGQIGSNTSTLTLPLPTFLNFKVKTSQNSLLIQSTIDIEVIVKDQIYFSILSEHGSLFISNIQSFQTGTFGNISSIFQWPNMIKVLFNPEMRNSLFISISEQASALELSIEEIQNTYLTQEFEISQEYFINSAYFEENRVHVMVGLPYMAANDNFIIQALYDANSYQYVLRQFSRHASQESLARADLSFTFEKSISFFVFPNTFVNTLLLSDGAIIDLINIQPQALVFNATNISSSLVTFNPQTISLRLIATDNYGFACTQNFNATYVPSQVVDIFVRYPSNKQNISYNCGDLTYQYQFNYVYCGPNYNLVDLNNNLTIGTPPYFKVVNPGFYLFFQNAEILSFCNISFILEPPSGADEYILICLDTVNSNVSSYSLYHNNTYSLTHSVNIPGSIFQYASLDQQSRELLVFTTNALSWVESNFQIYFFVVERFIIWKNCTKLNIDAGYNPKSLQFNSKNNVGVIVSSLNITTLSQSLIYFQLDMLNYSVYSFIQFSLSLQNSNTAIKCFPSNQGFIYVLYNNGILNIYSVSTSMKTMQFINTVKFNTSNILTFDISDSFFILYSGTNQIEVYVIESYIKLSYKMTLPLYEYDYYTFYLDQDSTLADGDYYVRVVEGIHLLVLMQSDDDMRMILFNLGVFQHETFIRSLSVINLLSFDSRLFIQMTENKGDTLLVSLQSLDSIWVYVLNPTYFIEINQYFQSELVKQCTETLSGEILIYDMNLVPYSCFQNTACDNDTYSVDFAKLNSSDSFLFNIMSINEGVSITRSQSPLQNHQTQSFDQAMSLGVPLIMTNYFNGYNIDYDYQCSYMNDQNTSVSCNNNIQSFTSPQWNVYLFEYVTSNRKILQTFEVGPFLITLDTMNEITFLFINQCNQNIQINCSLPDGILDYVSLDEQDLFNCVIQDYSVILPLQFAQNDTQYNITYEVLFLYQCVSDSKLELKASMMTFTNTSSLSTEHDIVLSVNSQNYYISIVLLKGGFKVGTAIIDIGFFSLKLCASYMQLVERQMDNCTNLKYYLRQLEMNQTQLVPFNTIKVKMTISPSITGLYNNQLINLDCIFDLTTNLFEYYHELFVPHEQYIKPNDILVIPNSTYCFATDFFYGVVLMDCSTLIIYYWFEFYSLDSYAEQDVRQLGALQIYTLAPNWPYEIHALSNYGIFVFTFENSLITDHFDPFQYFKFNDRVIRLHANQEGEVSYEKSVAVNQWGYAFLMKIFKEHQTSSTQYLVFVGFYQDYQSQLVDVFDLKSNVSCQSLNLFYPLQTQEIDRITISMVCQTQLSTITQEFNPYLLLSIQDQTKVNQIGSKLDLNDGQIRFNGLEVQITASNSQTNATVILFLSFVYDWNYENYGVLIGAFLLFAFTASLFIALTVFSSIQLKIQTIEEKRLKSVAQLRKDAKRFVAENNDDRFQNGKLIRNAQKLEDNSIFTIGEQSDESDSEDSSPSFATSNSNLDFDQLLKSQLLRSQMENQYKIRQAQQLMSSINDDDYGVYYTLSGYQQQEEDREERMTTDSRVEELFGGDSAN